MRRPTGEIDRSPTRSFRRPKLKTRCARPAIARPSCRREKAGHPDRATDRRGCTGVLVRCGAECTGRSRPPGNWILGMHPRFGCRGSGHCVSAARRERRAVTSPCPVLRLQIGQRRGIQTAHRLLSMGRILLVLETAGRRQHDRHRLLRQQFEAGIFSADQFHCCGRFCCDINVLSELSGNPGETVVTLFPYLRTVSFEWR